MIENIEELQELANKKRCTLQNSPQEIRICTGSSCASLGSDILQKELKKNFKLQKLDEKCTIKSVGCSGLCSEAIMVSHYDKEKKQETLYANITAEDTEKFYLYEKNSAVLEDKKVDTSTHFFSKQHKIVLENAGKLDPNDIEDYIAHDGYVALFKALEDFTPVELIQEIKQSGLRGRGGGGYPTGLKWETVSKVESTQKYIICNGDEGDPGAFMDRAIMEADPHRVLEGMLLAGYGCGASKGYIYVRAEYPVAVEKLQKAIKQCKKLGILGQNIALSGFSFDIEVRLGGGAFVCGEATALIRSIEGNRGNPRQKPPHLSDAGLFGEPTVLNNVETFANIAPIVKNGAAWFASIGTKTSTGTKVFALSGNIKNTGLVEVPMGISLEELIYDIGGGVSGTQKLKAIQTGGPSGGCIPASMMDVLVDYDSLKKVGSIMGSGGLIVMDESVSMLEVAHFFMDFCQSESCGKCVPCRVGTVELRDLLDKFIAQTATKEDFELLKSLCEVVKESSLCGLGQSAPNPVMSTLHYFEEEYLQGIYDD